MSETAATASGSPSDASKEVLTAGTTSATDLNGSAAILSMSADQAIGPDTAAANELEQTMEDDGKDDSEAETVLSSPVKRKEDLKRSTGLSSSLAKTASSAEGLSDAKQHTSTKAQFSDDEHESDLSDSSLGSELSQTRDIDDADLQSVSSNPRKRKHRASSFSGHAHGLDSAKRQRRASENKGLASSKSVGDTSPGPRSRRHELATSAAKEDPSIASGRSGRSRRSGGGMPSRASKTPQQQWDSDSDSEGDDLKVPPQARSTRNLNRSTSTPGRPSGKDHKRHINKYGFSKLAEACESGDLDSVKEWRKVDPESLELPEFAGNTPLQVASLNGYPEVVEYLLKEGCNAHCANTDKDTPLIDAVENGHMEVVELLLNAGVDPLRQNRKGQQALDVITEDTENGLNIRALLRKAIENRKETGGSGDDRDDKDNSTRLGPRQGLHFMARTPDNLLKLVESTDLDGVKQFLDAHVPVDNNIVAAAAATGDMYLVNMLLAEMSPKKLRSRPERIMLKVIGSAHFDMVKMLTELEYFNPLWRKPSDGSTWFEIAEKKGGPFWRKEQELLQRLYDQAMANDRLSSSPVSKRDSSIRRQRSPKPTKKTDGNVDDDTSPDVGRGKRRLVSRKDMRTHGARESPSAESAVSASSPEATTKASEGDPNAPTSRASGRPRTKSISIQNAPEVKTKRIQSGTSEKLALFESAAPPKKKKADESNQPRPAAGIAVKRNNSVTANTDSASNEVTDASAESTTMPATDDSQTEAAQAQRIAQEARQRQAIRLQRLDKLPRALYQVLAGNFTEVKDAAKFIEYYVGGPAVISFLPYDDQSTGSEQWEGLWMSNLQAAAILRGSAADLLLDIETEADADLTKAVGAVRTRPIPDDDRSNLVELFDLTRIGMVKDETPSDATMEQRSLAGAALTNARNDTRRRFRAAEPLRLVNLKDYYALETMLRTERAQQYPHLELLPAPEQRVLDSIKSNTLPYPALTRVRAPWHYD